MKLLNDANRPAELAADLIRVCAQDRYLDFWCAPGYEAHRRKLRSIPN